MNYQYPAVLKQISRALLLFFFRNIFQDMEGCAAGSHPLPIRIGKHRIVRSCGKQPLGQPVIDLFPVRTRLFFIGRSKDDVIPFDKAGLSQAVLIVFP